jgi:hypothetical protein
MWQSAAFPKNGPFSACLTSHRFPEQKCALAHGNLAEPCGHAGGATEGVNRERLAGHVIFGRANQPLAAKPFTYLPVPVKAIESFMSIIVCQ